MLAGSLPFAGLVNTTGYGAQLPLNHVSIMNMNFPDYFPMRVRLLVRLILEKEFKERAELQEVAEHIRLTYADILSDIIDNPISGRRYSHLLLPITPFNTYPLCSHPLFAPAQ